MKFIGFKMWIWSGNWVRFVFISSIRLIAYWFCTWFYMNPIFAERNEWYITDIEKWLNFCVHSVYVYRCSVSLVVTMNIGCCEKFNHLTDWFSSWNRPTSNAWIIVYSVYIFFSLSLHFVIQINWFAITEIESPEYKRCYKYITE